MKQTVVDGAYVGMYIPLWTDARAFVLGVYIILREALLVCSFS